MKMGMKLVEAFAVLRYYGERQCECVAECNSHARAVKAIEYYGGADSAGVYYRIELRYKVVEL
jgi:hypothetical protein